MAKFFTYCESKSTAQGLNQKMQSPDSMVVSSIRGFLSLNGLETRRLVGNDLEEVD
jgi:hypothetical protein